MRFSPITAALFAGSLLLVSCQSADSPETQASADAAAPVRTESAMLKLAAPGSPTAIPVTAQPQTNRLLIYTADVRVRVEQLAPAAAQLDSLVRRSGGWISHATENRQDGDWSQRTEIRVPPARFGVLLGAIGQLGTVETKTLGTEDVTAQHADVTARLAAKRAVEQEYLRLLKQAHKVSELLEVQQKLGEVREEIEATESRLKTLNDQVAYSTLDVTLYQRIALPTPDAPVVSFGSRLASAFYGGWEIFIGLLLGVVNLWPVWLLVAAGWPVVRWWKQRR